jgi:hypothetical protein
MHFLWIMSACLLPTNSQTYNVSEPYNCVNSICYSVDGIELSAVLGSSNSSLLANNVPKITAVGCLNTFSITFWKSSSGATPLKASDVRFCKNRQCTAEKSSLVNGFWLQGSNFARQCCMLPASKRAKLCDPAKDYKLNPLDTFACSSFTLSTKNSSGPTQIVANVQYIPPLTSDLRNNGVDEICFCVGSSCPTIIDPICIEFKVRRMPASYSVLLPLYFYLRFCADATLQHLLNGGHNRK